MAHVLIIFTIDIIYLYISRLASFFSFTVYTFTLNLWIYSLHGFMSQYNLYLGKDSSPNIFSIWFISPCYTYRLGFVSQHNLWVFGSCHNKTCWWLHFSVSLMVGSFITFIHARLHVKYHSFMVLCLNIMFRLRACISSCTNVIYSCMTSCRKLI
jgi:hypothetical protein